MCRSRGFEGACKLFSQVVDDDRPTWKFTHLASSLRSADKKSWDRCMGPLHSMKLRSLIMLPALTSIPRMMKR